ncbi:MAG TPA: hypothetical protein VGG44_10885 [Tepidisphaeraceae bacterium]
MTASASYTITDLGTLAGAAIPTAISNNGRIAGFVFVASTYPDAFVYDSGSLTELGTFGGPTSSAACINDIGQAAGISDLNGTGVSHAFLYSSGMTTDLGTLGGPESVASGINATGEVVGDSETSSFGQTLAFVYANGMMTSLGTLGGQYSSAKGINDSGQIVGSSSASHGGSEHAFLYSNGTMTDLSNLVAVRRAMPTSSITADRCLARRLHLM